MKASAIGSGGIGMKGSKRDRWLKDGVRESKKHFKALWNRRVRYSSKICGSTYKKIAGRKAMLMYVP